MQAETVDNQLRRTPLFDRHKAAGAKFVEFGGWEMPVQYSGLVDEHNTVRSAAGLFDVSHMGEVFVRGENALAFLQHLTSNNVAKLSIGQAQYSLLPNESGGVVDDIIIYRLADQEYLICVNAANTEKDFNWLNQHNTFGVELEDASPRFGQIALQGPAAEEILAKFLGVARDEVSIEQFPAFTVRRVSFSPNNADELLIARTGYTGEDGVEIFCPAEVAAAVWDSLLEHGGEHGLKPIGLGARDTLRLEACYPLHGHELRDDITALESGLKWVVKLKKGEFIGRDALSAQHEAGLKRKLVGLEVVGQGIVRHDTPLFDPDGNSVGWVTSGTKPPTVGKAIGLAIVASEVAKIGTKLVAEVRGRPFEVEVIKKPFYKR